jgi:hypothetical protein
MPVRMAFRKSGRSAEALVRRLTDPALWGRDIEAERYLLPSCSFRAKMTALASRTWPFTRYLLI